MSSAVTLYLVIITVALLVSGLTLFSGFGLGTFLMPAFALFFPVEVAIAATAVVHLANNLFKVALMGRKAAWNVVARFAAPAAIAAVAGSLVLTYLSDLPALLPYTVGQSTLVITPVKLVIGGLIAVFALLELIPALEKKIQFRPEHLPLGGALSGFFGGLSGNQGALRSAVLIHSGLNKEAFIATGVVCAVVVDCFRLVVYGVSFYSGHFDVLVTSGGVKVVIAATAAAFAGAYIGARLMKKVTMKAVHWIVGLMLLLIAGGLMVGLI